MPLSKIPCTIIRPYVMVAYTKNTIHCIMTIYYGTYGPNLSVCKNYPITLVPEIIWWWHHHQITFSNKVSTNELFMFFSLNFAKKTGINNYLMSDLIMCSLRSLPVLTKNCLLPLPLSLVHSLCCTKLLRAHHPFFSFMMSTDANAAVPSASKHLGLVQE